MSVTAAVFLVDMICQCRFRECSGLIKAIQQTLNPDHPIRRLMLPFTFGTVYANRVYNEYFKQNGLYHRVFGFTYSGLAKLIRDSMSNALCITGGKYEKNKYRFRLLKKQISKMKDLPQEVYPIWKNVSNFWNYTLQFVEKYIGQYYGDDKSDTLLFEDYELKRFYDALLINCNINKKFRLKKFNIINILTHFICNATIWHSHLTSAVSFDYKIDPKFNGLKINHKKTNDHHGGCSTNSISNYAQYCLVVLSKGWNLMSFDGLNNIYNQDIEGVAIIEETNNNDDDHNTFNTNDYDQDAKWSQVVLDDDKLFETKKIFNSYFKNDIMSVTYNIDKLTKISIAPYNIMNPKYFSSSIML